MSPALPTVSSLCEEEIRLPLEPITLHGENNEVSELGVCDLDRDY